MRFIEVGDYVLATKYKDGDPMDPFCVGRVTAIYHDRYDVMFWSGDIDVERSYRRVHKITPDEGAELISLFPEISDQLGGPSLWTHLKKIRRSKL